MTPTRRLLLSTGWALPLAAAAPAVAQPRLQAPPAPQPNTTGDQTAFLQAAIDAAAARGVALDLPAGRFKTGPLVLREGSSISGVAGLTVLQFTGSGTLMSAKSANGIRLADLAIDGGMRPLDAVPGALLAFEGCAGLHLQGLAVANSSRSGLAISGGGGLVTGCTFTVLANAAIAALDATVAISANTITNCGNNGILVWRSTAAEDGSHVRDNTISHIRADSGGSGQNGNGINVFRAGNVMVSGNRITDCAYSAIRANAASNIQMNGNHCQRIGEVALYAEFGFSGALICANIVDGAATGISVTNFNEGGRLAVIQGNLIRNLIRREHEPQDKRGEGIAVEADTLVAGNTIENAPTCGILIGWGRHMRDVSASGNLIRGCRTGILISSDPGAGSALVTANLVSGARDGAIRAHELGRPFGPDLARAAPSTGRVQIAGNTAA